MIDRALDGSTLEKPMLAFDTSGVTAHVAVLDGQARVIATAAATAARHSGQLLGLVDEVLRTAAIRPDELGTIACGGGPGSFTGLRVGMALAKGLGLPFATRFVLVPSLDALADDLDSDGTRDRGVLVPCIDAGKGEVHARLLPVGSGPPIAGVDPTADLRMPPDRLCETLRPLLAAGWALRLGGTGLDRHLTVFADRLGQNPLVTPAPGPTGVSIAKRARARLARGECDDLAAAVPHYGRAPDITRPRPKREAPPG